MTRTDHATSPRTDETGKIEKLHGADRSGLGEKGWAEAPADRIGGHPELETAPDPAAGGGLNGPQPETDLETGATKMSGPESPSDKSGRTGSGVMHGASSADSPSSH
jgi:hypothetical protein